MVVAQDGGAGARPRRAVPSAVVAAVLGAVLAALGGPAAHAAAHAAEPAPQSGVSVQPARGAPFAAATGSHLELGRLSPGQLVRTRVVVVNVGPQPRTVRVYPASGVPARGGGFGFSGAGPADGFGAWTTLSADRLQLPANGRAAIDVTVRVPADPGTGENVGAVVAEPVVTAGRDHPLVSVARFAMAAYYTLPGPVRPALAVADLTATASGRTVCAQAHVSNPGTTIVVVDAVLTARPQPVGAARTVETPRVLTLAPGTAETVPVGCATGPPGRWQLDLALTADGTRASAATTVWVVRPALPAAGAALVVLLGGLTWLALGRPGGGRTTRRPRSSRSPRSARSRGPAGSRAPSPAPPAARTAGSGPRTPGRTDP